MIVTLIPLFLAASIGVKENDWEYGPEVIYDARVDIVSYPFEKPEINFNVTMKLKCRSKSCSSLICQFHDSNKNDNETISIVDDTCGRESFELKFNAEGLEEIVVPSIIKPLRLDMIRALVGQLNIGADFSVVPTNEFEILENFATGLCTTSYVLSSRDANDETRTMRPYEVIIVPGMIRLRDEIKEIDRTRNPDKCDNRVDYFFGSEESLAPASINIETKIKRSKSRMVIMKRGLTSWTENTIIVRNNRLNTNGEFHRLVERMTLSLDDIVPASGPLPTISEPASASIFPGRSLRDDSSKDKSIFQEINRSEETNDLN